MLLIIQCFIRLESLELVMCMIDSNLRVRTKCRLLGAQLITQARFNDTIIFIDKTFNVIQYLVTSKRSFVILIAFLTLNIICTIIIIQKERGCSVGKHVSLSARGCGFETRNLMPSCRGGGR